ncbi:MAG: site-2 protease family protein [Melioribacteraceae bacterium]|nr:site-2 protease family protein [Melioribacteraceae bacterium]MCF8354634.1 site-2 protease family protein [Melioribacteraceae bacterium]MCF8395022.1 site-2 protease family protein [Melioribacteraceae bacterium]MCF8418874.1 site-2 protease family protein [Melioribacteraceae bacterium]
MEWTTGSMGPYEFADLAKGLPYALSILFILSFHEFGHYFAAKYHKVDTTLPFYIPFPPIPGFFHFGTMGAVIKTRSVIPNNKSMFDIGVWGPISGFAACLIIISYGFLNLPEMEYILTIHPDYLSPEYGKDALSLEFGDTILFALMRELFTNPQQFVPPMSEIYHYPYLCTGWFGLFVTAMNMIPVGQLDGGHVVYSMFGHKKHEAVASIAMIVLMVLGGLGVLDTFMDFQTHIGWTGWLFWAFILYIFIKIKHPPVPYFEQLDSNRMLIGYFSLVIFIISFSPTPFILSIS